MNVNRARVVHKFPNAYVDLVTETCTWVVWSSSPAASKGAVLLGTGISESTAWMDAAQRYLSKEAVQLDNRVQVIGAQLFTLLAEMDTKNQSVRAAEIYLAKGLNLLNEELRNGNSR